MKKLLLILALLFARAAHATITNVQAPIYTGCSTSSISCTPSTTIPAIGSGHLLFMQFTNNGGANDFVASVTQSGYCSTAWVIPTGAQWSGGSSEGAGSAAYCLSSVSGATVEPPFSWAATNPGFSGVKMWEESTSLSAFILDTNAGAVGTFASSFASTTQTGVTPVLNGSNDVIFQAVNFASTGVASVTIYNNFDATFGGMANLINTTNVSPPVWTGNASGNARGNMVAFTETGGASTFKTQVGAFLVGP
jgi:hypothetical protein